jgi:hypothetical protein
MLVRYGAGQAPAYFHEHAKRHRRGSSARAERNIVGHEVYASSLAVSALYAAQKQMNFLDGPCNLI